MFVNLKKKNAQAVLEYIALIMLIMGAMLIFRKYIGRGFTGRWKATGDAFGKGALYDPDHTTECSFLPSTNTWYDQECFDDNCVQECLGQGSTQNTCHTCLSAHTCFSPRCND